MSSKNTVGGTHIHVQLNGWVAFWPSLALVILAVLAVIY